jgi:hypothetical protein
MIDKLYDQFLSHLKGIPDLYVPRDPTENLLPSQLKCYERSDNPWIVEKQDMEILAERAWVEEVKYFLCLPMARYLRNDPPNKPSSSDGFFPAGNLRRWFKARINAENNTNTHLWYSFLQAKRSCDPFSEAHAYSLFRDHFEALTKTDPYLNFGRDPEACAIIDDILGSESTTIILETVRKELESNNSLRHLPTAFLSSATNTHACYERTRGHGGKVAHLRDLVDLNPTGLEDHESDSVTSDCLFSMNDVLLYKNNKYKHVVVEKRCSSEYETWESLGKLDLNFLKRLPNGEFTDWLCELDESDLSYTDFRKKVKRPERFLESETGTNLFCEVRGVLEPLKCRMISKGEALPYSLCKPIQEALFKILKKMPCFRLIGRTFDPTMLYDLAKDAKPDHEWLSIDYKAATDNLSWYFSYQIMRRLLVNFPSDIVELALKVLGPHVLSYPSPGGDRVDTWGVQTNGQLMGSILSFPILCLANLFVYLYVTKDEKGTLKSKLRRVLVNGDDMLYTGTPQTYLRHARISRAVGLELSVGKAYCHPRYANINSTSVVYDLGRIPFDPEKFPDWRYRESRLYGKNTPSPIQINYLNVGLLLNKHKVQGATDEDEERMRAGMSRYEIEEEKFEEWKEKKKKVLVGLSHEQVWDEYRSYLLKCRGFFMHSYQLSRKFAQSHTFEDSRSGITENIPLILEGCKDDNSKIQVLKWILEVYRDEIKRQTTFPFRELNTGKIFLSTRNLFLPYAFGGMGIIPPPGFKFRITQFQIGLVRRLFEDYKFSKMPMRGYQGSSLITEKQLPCQKPLPVLFQEPICGYTGSKNKIKKGFLRSWSMPKRCFDHPHVLY